MPRSSRSAPLVAFVVPLLFFACRSDARAEERSACAAGETAVVVDTRAHVLFLCEGGAVHRRFSVALGVGGVGKRRMGDGKTPLGLYPLAVPRRSRDYGIFIGVGYPTRQQARLGFTGNAVGLHGPPRGVWGAPRNDWTAGCIALGADDDIAAVAAWVGKQRLRLVRIY